ncbi:hypothetical protein H8356DRAFT_1334253 [Neocallimastix lanati (nom. inval.)]|nr:hypothetical protein H8356DRAFT_1334253 [Neocallimastix sp. JGI-2020a]
MYLQIEDETKGSKLYWSHFKALGEVVPEKILSNKLHVRAPMLKHSVRPISRNNSAFMEVCDYLNIPTAPEGD